jgi:hypothetical protein
LILFDGIDGMNRIECDSLSLQFSDSGMDKGVSTEQVQRYFQLNVNKHRANYDPVFIRYNKIVVIRCKRIRKLGPYILWISFLFSR